VALHVLHHAATAPVHGAWLRAELAHHGYRISPGTLYPILHKMEGEGLLASAPEVVGGRARRTYAITGPGRAALEELRRALAELADEALADRVRPAGSVAQGGRGDRR
jgi:DNA-binding PadR family transcriptional regulator